MAFIDLMKRIEEKSVEVGDCWEWRGAKNFEGRPITTYHGKTMPVQRAIAKRKGRMKDGMVAYATCGNVWCSNPAHNAVQTKSDAIKRGWANADKGAMSKRMSNMRKGYTGITDELVKEIRTSDETNAEIARRTGVTKSSVSKIRLYRTRPDFTNPFRLL